MDELGRRAQLSMLGKGIIGLLGGVIILFVTWIRTCNKDNSVELESPGVQWFNQHFRPSDTLDSNKRITHFGELGVRPEVADSIAEFIASRRVGGSIAHELNKKEIDSLNKALNLFLPNADSKNKMLFFVQSLKREDYIVITKDSLIENIVSVPE